MTVTNPAAPSGTIDIGGDLTVRRMGFGAMRVTGAGNLGDPRDATRPRPALRRVHRAGGQPASTPPTRTDRSSASELIAEALHPYPDDLVIATKGGLDRNGPNQGVQRSYRTTSSAACDGSLRRLRLERDPAVPAPPRRPAGPVEDSVGHLVGLKDGGQDPPHRVVCNVSEDGTAALRSRGSPDRLGPEPVRPPDRSSEAILDRCEQEALAFLPWAPLGGGRRRCEPVERIAGRHGVDRPTGRARLAAGALAGDAADPGHRLGCAPRGERRRPRASGSRPTTSPHCPTPHEEHPMSFVPTANKPSPDLSPAQEIVLLARTLWREGYNDHLAGHITYNLGDDTLLCNPWMLLWNEFRARDIIRIDLDGNVLEGDWPVPPRHPAASRTAQVAAWSRGGDAQPSGLRHRVGRHGRSAAGDGPIQRLGGGELVLVDEYDGAVNDPNSARRAVEKMGAAELALLAGHGVFVLGPRRARRAPAGRGSACEQRCKHAWHVRAAGGSRRVAGTTVVARPHGAERRQRVPRVLESSACCVLGADPTLLDERLAVEESIRFEVEDLARVARAHQLEHAVAAFGAHAVHRAEDRGEQRGEQRAARSRPSTRRTSTTTRLPRPAPRDSRGRADPRARAAPRVRARCRSGTTRPTSRSRVGSPASRRPRPPAGSRRWRRGGCRAGSHCARASARRGGRRTSCRPTARAARRTPPRRARTWPP